MEIAQLNKELTLASYTQDQKLKDVCQDFESVFLGYMFKSMRNTLSEDTLLHGGAGEDLYQSLYDQRLAENIAKGDSSSIGIANMLYNQLKTKTV